MKPYNFRPLGVVLMLLAGSLVPLTDGLAVMSIDFGGEYLKIGIVKPGVPMEIVLNKESQRKTPCVVSFRGGERQIGDPACSTAVKWPTNAYQYLTSVLGKKLDSPQVESFIKKFPYYKIKADPDTGTVIFQHDDKTEFTPEELVAMLLQRARDAAEAFADQPIKDVVITVPAFFNQAERRAMLRAAEISGFNVLQLMSDNSAVALNYGIFRRKAFNGTAQYYMFYDMGSTSTVASVVSYQVVKMKDSGYVETNPQLTILGVGYDSTLGGLEFQTRLRDHLAKSFNDQKKTKTDVTTNHRSMAKLFKEAGRVMKVLSANVDHMAQVESLLDDVDFKVKVSRAEFEEMCADLFDRVAKPIDDALKASHLTMDIINEVILMGGSTRIPKVQEILLKTTGKDDLGKSINTDEAAAMGAVYQAAYLSKGYRVKKFGVKEANVYPIQVEFEKSSGSESDSHKVIRRTLFGLMNPYPQRKVMTFNKHTKDFSFSVNYGDRKDEIVEPLFKVELTGVDAAIGKHAEAGESKGVKAHFRMDESGILQLEKVESVFEKTAPAEEDESTLSKLGSTISNFFSGGDSAKTEEKEGEKTDKADKTEDKKDDEKKDEKTTDKQEEPKTEKNEEKKDESKKEEGKKEEKTEDPKNATAKNDTASGKNDTKKAEPKTIVIKEPIEKKLTVLDLPSPTDVKYDASKKLVEDYRKQDEERRLLAKARNELETFVYGTREKMYIDEYEKCANEEEKTKINEKLSEISDFIDEADDHTPRSEFDSRLKILKDLTNDWFYRVKELHERPQAIKTLHSMLNHSQIFLGSIKNLTKDEPIFTEVEVNTLGKLINETWDWLNKTIKQQDSTPLYEKPVLVMQDIGLKLSSLDREVKYLINKAKNYKPKPKKEETKSDNSTDKTSSDSSKSEKSSDKKADEEKKESKKESESDKKSDTVKDDTVKEESDKQESDKESKNKESKKEDKDTKTESEDKKTDEIPPVDDDSKDKDDASTHSPDEL